MSSLAVSKAWQDKSTGRGPSRDGGGGDEALSQAEQPGSLF